MTVLDLPWLPPAPAGFRAAYRAAGEAEAPGSLLRDLARTRLDTNQLTALSRAIERCIEAGADLAPLVPFHLGILAKGTTALFAPTLAASAARHGVALTVTVAPYDQVVQQAVDPDSPINRADVDAVLLSWDYADAGSALWGDSDASEREVDRRFDEIVAVREALRRAHERLFIFETIPQSGLRQFGHLDSSLVGARSRMVADLNRRICDYAGDSGDVVIDKADLAASIGFDRWHDARQWHLHKLPFSPEAIPLYSDHVGRVVGAIRGQSAKCLVLDLDNTLWGGEIGDVGVAGIELGSGTGLGEAFTTFQQVVRVLGQRGVILAVCSKNDQAAARAPFIEHPDMVLTESDIAVFVANWADKASNLETIADTLGIGLNALVFVDDNPAERSLVRQALPEVRVLEVGSDPASFPETLLGSGYFETVAFSADDRLRGEQYRANSRRVNSRRTSAEAPVRDLDDYLASLDMVIDFAPFDDVGRPRVVQLINKSNQFNLTTRRYTDAQVRSMQDDSRVVTLQVRLRDAFGDNGMISVVICREGEADGGASWAIDTWLMSCRVIGRGVETAVLEHLVEAASAAGIQTLVGRYEPTPHNGLVATHYERLGFEGAAGEGATTWVLDVAAFKPASHHCRREGEDGAVVPRPTRG